MMSVKKIRRSRRALIQALATAAEAQNLTPDVHFERFDKGNKGATEARKCAATGLTLKEKAKP